MKKMIVALSVFGLGALGLLIAGTVFLMKQTDTMTALWSMIGIMLFASVGLGAMDVMGKNKTLTDSLSVPFLTLMLPLRHLASAILALGTVYIMCLVLSFLITIPQWLPGAVLLGIALICVVAVVLAILILCRRDKAKPQKEAKAGTAAE